MVNYRKPSYEIHVYIIREFYANAKLSGEDATMARKSWVREMDIPYDQDTHITPLKMHVTYFKKDWMLTYGLFIEIFRTMIGYPPTSVSK